LGLGMTLYTSQLDRALWLSRLMSGVERAGRAPVVVDGVDTIDISGIGASLWNSNHAVYTANPLVFGDIDRLIASGERPPDKRSSFFQPQGDGMKYWGYRIPPNDDYK